ncbi:LysR family transcriptional regulator [Mangrovitalea sediminis]|uniref:LysR family transcriptional regulator n=1 Tax=Mangrovitalea sediminis TaxID=1982043 RepID=UPI001D0D02A8|nr:LysR family transcriptional regulator [Mangrovitalea sediminis]
MRAADLGLLVSLSVLLEEANVTRAAERLHMTQPALSAQLSRLRRLFDDPLLIPASSGRGMVLTARAQALRDPLNRQIQALTALVDRPPVFDPQTVERTFNIVTNDNLAVMLCVDLIALISRNAGPGVRVALQHMAPEAAQLNIERQQIDLVLSTPSALPATLIKQPLLSDQFCVAQRKNHPRGIGAMELDEYCRWGHMMVSGAGGRFQSAIDERLQEQGRQRRVAVSVQHYSLVPRILSETDYLATLPKRFLMRFSNELDTFEVPFDRANFEVAMAWHPRDDADPGSQWLRDVLTGIAAQ